MKWAIKEGTVLLSVYSGTDNPSNFFKLKSAYIDRQEAKYNLDYKLAQFFETRCITQQKELNRFNDRITSVG